MQPDDARRVVTLEMGRVEVVKEQVRDIRAGAFADTVLKDLRYGARLLQRNPVFAVTATLSLAIGIAANTTIFTIANALLFRAPAGVSSRTASSTSPERKRARRFLTTSPRRTPTTATFVSARRRSPVCTRMNSSSAQSPSRSATELSTPSQISSRPITLLCLAWFLLPADSSQQATLRSQTPVPSLSSVTAFGRSA